MYRLNFDQKMIWSFYNDRVQGRSIRPVRSQNPKSHIVKKNKRKTEKEEAIEVYLQAK